MILTKAQVDLRINSEENSVNKINNLPEVIIKDGKNHVGRPGSKNLTSEEKVIIGTAANILGNEAAAELMGVSEHTARHLRTAQTTESEGRGTQKHGQDENLKKQIEARLEEAKLTIHERAAEKLLGAMNLIDDDKLANSSAKELAQISSQMSQVIRNMNNGNNKNDSGPKGVKITFIQPRASKEEHFEVIEIGVNK